MVFVKGFGGGFLVGVCFVIWEVVVGMIVGLYGLIFGGNFLVMVVGLMVVDVISENGFLECV